MSDSPDDGSEPPDRPSADQGIDRSVVEAKRYFERIDEHPEDVRKERERVIEQLSTPQLTDPNELEQRVAASGALAKLARDEPSSLEELLPELVGELRRETDVGGYGESPENRAKARTVRANLVETVSRLLINTSERTVEKNAFTNFLGAVATDLDDETLRVATQALFATANERARELASVAKLLNELLAYPDAVVQGWTAGTVGQVAATHPDAIAATATNLRRLLTHEDSTVQHNTVEAFAAFVGTRPDVVAPAADTLRELLDLEEEAIQHNAAGVLCVLAEHHPRSVIPAVKKLQDLRDHEDNAVRRIATATLARLARERPDAVASSKPENS